LNQQQDENGTQLSPVIIIDFTFKYWYVRVIHVRKKQNSPYMQTFRIRNQIFK
jgi:hypothetical protein